ncbi:MAG TPA: hypothetical protein VKY85_08840 [Candidatus Angelobacter sp.]|nr:hypothetical protein [Candidatus Angelobacter sp.]
MQNKKSCVNRDCLSLSHRPMIFEHARQSQLVDAAVSQSRDWLRILVRNLATGFQRVCLLGTVVFLTVAAKAQPVTPPPGPYHQSCRDVSANAATLTATCKDFFGNFRKTDISGYSACTGSFTDVNGAHHPLAIENVDGRLTCVISKGIRHDKFDTGSEFDIISMPQHFTRGNQEETIWRIDRPQVWSPRQNGEVDYVMIRFKPGDRLSFVAGGCVQTGGKGRTWKRYTDPSGPSAQELYWGTVFIPGVTLGIFEKVGIVAKQGLKIIPPAPQGTHPATFLKLGYIDNEMDDNGYYSHDDGTGDQCKNEGPAWLEITVLSGVQSSGPLWSPHSKPFDLVWDMATGEDENGLPMNPQWDFAIKNWQPKVDLAHWNPAVGQGEQPHFIPLCGRAFPSKPVGQYEIDFGTLGQICTSMSVDFDLRPSGGGLCGGDPFPGHMNFGIATFQGPVTWDAYSGPWPNDNDWSFAMVPRNGAGLAGANDGPEPAAALHLEFDAMEVPLPLFPFWKDLLSPPIPLPEPNSSIGQVFGGPDWSGLEGVAIGVIGLDGVHGANTELHPLYAIAVRLEQTQQQPGTVQEKWAFLLRNYGDEGTCSENTWRWDGTDFFIPLEWPDGATGDVNHANDVRLWQENPNPAIPVDIEVNKDQRFTLIHVGAPQSVGEFAVGGTVTLSYKVAGGTKARKIPARTAARKPPVREVETEAPDLSSRISDPAIRAKYLAAVNALAPTASVRSTAIQVQIRPAVTLRKHVAGAASHGKLVRPRAVPNLAKQRQDLEIFKLLQTFQKDLKIELPAELPRVVKPVPVETRPK